MKVIVVEDQLLFQEFLVNLLKEKLSMEVVGVAGDGESALEMILNSKPDLVILDILIPKLSGILVARAVLDKYPTTRILAISSETDIKTIHQVHQLNLSGFIDKNEASMDVLVEAIRAIQQHKRYFSKSLQLTIRKLKADPLAFQKILSKREQEILTYIGGGLSDLEIGQRLGLSDTSIQSHRRNLFRKLDVHSTPELIRFAQESGFWKASFRKMGLSESYHIHE
ncbi:response regulator transcription factor [Puniceicoccales bacterium CK1056]|uniref:Response regulator transcription factor n=1 Tax=Oceanipulchritudo coccoides TaxID=2706888 RepID=A0A6B2LZB9_9BACT|nr:response regulator transcription factor [Oceanipulchritudo coccoides]NDV61389.1 response regulator transcription factor [Oceanipulchritudo coccoides]